MFRRACVLSVLAVLSIGSSVFAGSASFTMNLVNSSQATFYLSSNGPSGFTSGSTPISGYFDVTITYPTPMGSACPAPNSISFDDSFLAVDDITLNLNWGSPSGTYTYNLDGAVGEVAGGPFSVSSGSINFSGGSVGVNEGVLTETGTGTIGGSCNRTTNYSTSGRTYTTWGLSISGTRVSPSNKCEYTLNFGGYPSDSLRTSPVNMGIMVSVFMQAKALTNL